MVFNVKSRQQVEATSSSRGKAAEEFQTATGGKNCRSSGK
jgi:hypothetical protein